jgi:glycosyltransferase involved in cell wall biosynthesis
VDTRLYAAALDLFLESFPFGTGVVPYQALGAGTPLLSYFSKMTVFGVNFWHEFPGDASANLERYPILCARTPDEYVRLANELIADADFRSRVAARGRQFFEEEMNSIPGYSKRFFDTIAEIAADVLGQRRASER